MKKGLTVQEQILALPYTHVKDGKIYVRVNYKRDDGTRTSKEKLLPSDATPSEAMLEIAKIKAKLNRSPELLEGEKMNFEELVDAFKDSYPKIKPWYIAPLSFFNGRKIISITYKDCQRFKEARHAVGKRHPDPTLFVPRKAATINREVEVLRAILLYAVRYGLLTRTVFTAGEPLLRKSEETRRRRLPTPDEEARLLSACVGKRQHLKALIIATRDTGLRRSAVQALDFAQLNWETGLLEVPPATSKHKGRPNVIGLTARLRIEIEAIWNEKGQPTEGKIFDKVADFKRAYKAACGVAGISGLRYNDLRHGFATDLMEADISKRLAMKAAGHRNEDVHEIYTNVDARLARQVADALDKLHADRQQTSSGWPSLASEALQ